MCASFQTLQVFKARTQLCFSLLLGRACCHTSTPPKPQSQCPVATQPGLREGEYQSSEQPSLLTNGHPCSDPPCLPRPRKPGGRAYQRGPSSSDESKRPFREHPCSLSVSTVMLYKVVLPKRPF